MLETSTEEILEAIGSVNDNNIISLEIKVKGPINKVVEYLRKHKEYGVVDSVFKSFVGLESSEKQLKKLIDACNNPEHNLYWLVGNITIPPIVNFPEETLSGNYLH